jgi:hypothetical protein
MDRVEPEGVESSQRAMVNGFSRSAPEVIGRNVLALARRLDRSSCSRVAGCSIQERVDIKTAVPPELEMSLVQSGALIANPRVTQISIGVSSSQIHGHGTLLVNTAAAHRATD